MNNAPASLFRFAAAVAMLFCSLVPISAGIHGLFTYEVVEDTISITDYPTSAVGEVVIPSEINGIPVTTIGNGAFYGCSTLTGITIPDTVTDIGNWAFHGCYQLTSITIPGSVTTIDYLAFAACHGLTRITIPKNVASIGFSAFTSCVNLTTILVEPGNPGYSSREGVLFNADMTTLIQCPAGISGTYSIPDSVTTIGREAFGNCHLLTSIGIPDTVTTLADWAFFHCDGLTSITLPQRVDSIGSYAFEGCRRLMTFTIPASVTRIETGAWDGCTALTAILVDAGNTAYSSRDGVLFDASFTILLRYPIGLSGSYVIPGGVSTIADHAFENCKQLTTLIIPDGVAMIGDRAFENCGELTSVTIPPSITRIGESAFRDCRRLKNALFLGDVPLLGSGAFRNTASRSRTDPGFTIYYLAGSSGFPTPTWDEKPTVSIDLEIHPAAPWLLTHTLPYDSDLGLDLNGDGVSLLLAYALDLDPNTNLAGSLPTPQMGPDAMSISFYGARPGIGYTVESSDDMMTWDKDRVTLSEPDASGQRTATVDRDSPRRFLRLLVNQ